MNEPRPRRSRLRRIGRPLPGAAPAAVPSTSRISRVAVLLASIRAAAASSRASRALFGQEKPVRPGEQLALEPEVDGPGRDLERHLARRQVVFEHRGGEAAGARRPRDGPGPRRSIDRRPRRRAAGRPDRARRRRASAGRPVPGRSKPRPSTAPTGAPQDRRLAAGRVPRRSRVCLRSTAPRSVGPAGDEISRANLPHVAYLREPARWWAVLSEAHHRLSGAGPQASPRRLRFSK